MAKQPQQTIERYLEQVAERLAGMPRAERGEIVEELRSHILERAGNGELTTAGVDEALRSLGDPNELANEYVTDTLLARAEVGRSPLRILDALFGWGTLSVTGLLVLVGSLLGYFLGAALILCAFLKPFHPHAAGLWLIPAGDDFALSLRMGFEGTPPGSRDLLGWWIVPLGLLLGSGLIVFTTFFAAWCVRQYRQSHTPTRKLNLHHGSSL